MTVLTSVDMYDATNPQNIPSNAQYVAGYVDGHWPTYSQLATLFPNAKRFSFAVFAADNAHCLDVENGNATPAQAPGWALRQRANGGDPWVYCSQLGTYGWQAVQDAFNAQKVAHPHYFIATYNGTRALPVLNGFVAVAHQYVDTGPYDVSSLSDTAIALLGGTMTDPLDEQIARAGTRYDGTPEPASTTLRAEVAWDDSHWDQAIGGINATLTAVKGIVTQLTAQGAQIAGLVSAVSALTAANAANQPVTQAELTAIVDQAVAQHISITGTVQITPAPPTTSQFATGGLVGTTGMVAGETAGPPSGLLPPLAASAYGPDSTPLTPLDTTGGTA